jgi:hypothetical protein
MDFLPGFHLAALTYISPFESINLEEGAWSSAHTLTHDLPSHTNTTLTKTAQLPINIRPQSQPERSSKPDQVLSLHPVHFQNLHPPSVSIRAILEVLR